MNEQVERDLKEIVDVCKRNMPKPLEIRVFGSYYNGNWHPEKSDVDVFLLIDSLNAGEYSLREIFNRHSANNKTNKTRFEVHTFTPYSINCIIDNGRGNLCENARNGRLLYKKSWYRSLIDEVKNYITR